MLKKNKKLSKNQPIFQQRKGTVQFFSFFSQFLQFRPTPSLVFSFSTNNTYYF